MKYICLSFVLLIGCNTQNKLNVKDDNKIASEAMEYLNNGDVLMAPLAVEAINDSKTKNHLLSRLKTNNQVASYFDFSPKKKISADWLCETLDFNTDLPCGIPVADLTDIINTQKRQTEPCSCTFNSSVLVMRILGRDIPCINNLSIYEFIQNTKHRNPINVVSEMRPGFYGKFENQMPTSAQMASQAKILWTGKPAYDLAWEMNQMNEDLYNENKYPSLNKKKSNNKPNGKFINAQVHNYKSYKDATDAMKKVISEGGLVMPYFFNSYWSWHGITVLYITKDNKYVCWNSDHVEVFDEDYITKNMNTEEFYEDNLERMESNKEIKDRAIYDVLVGNMNSLNNPSHTLNKQNLDDELQGYGYPKGFNPMQIDTGFTFIQINGSNSSSNSNDSNNSSDINSNIDDQKEEDIIHAVQYSMNDLNVSDHNNQNNSFWSCSVCTYDNGLNSSVCEICGNPQETKMKTSQKVNTENWTCSECTFINKNSDKKCIICSRPQSINKPNNNSNIVDSNVTELIKCANCSNNSGNLLRCAGCKSVYYCNATCQKQHWKQHKMTCKTMNNQTNK